MPLSSAAIAMVLIPGCFTVTIARAVANSGGHVVDDASGFMHPQWDFALDRTAAPLLLAHDGVDGLDWTHYRVDGAPAGLGVG